MIDSRCDSQPISAHERQQATVETGDSDDNSREAAGGGTHQTKPAKDAGPFRYRSAFKASSHCDTILSKDQLMPRLWILL